MSQSSLNFLMQTLTTFAFVLLAYYLLRFVSKKMKFGEKKPITAFKVAIIAGALDLFLVMLYDLVTTNRTLVFFIFSIIELSAFYYLMKITYKIRWQYSLSSAFFLWFTVIVAQVAVLIGMIAFLAIYASI